MDLRIDSIIKTLECTRPEAMTINFLQDKDLVYFVLETKYTYSLTIWSLPQLNELWSEDFEDYARYFRGAYDRAYEFYTGGISVSHPVNIQNLHLRQLQGEERQVPVWVINELFGMRMR